MRGLQVIRRGRRHRLACFLVSTEREKERELSKALWVALPSLAATVADSSALLRRACQPVSCRFLTRRNLTGGTLPLRYRVHCCDCNPALCWAFALTVPGSAYVRPILLASTFYQEKKKPRHADSCLKAVRGGACSGAALTGGCFPRGGMRVRGGLPRTAAYSVVTCTLRRDSLLACATSWTGRRRGLLLAGRTESMVEEGGSACLLPIVSHSAAYLLLPPSCLPLLCHFEKAQATPPSASTPSCAPSGPCWPVPS